MTSTIPSPSPKHQWEHCVVCNRFLGSFRATQGECTSGISREHILQPLSQWPSMDKSGMRVIPIAAVICHDDDGGHACFAKLPPPVVLTCIVCERVVNPLRKICRLRMTSCEETHGKLTRTGVVCSSTCKKKASDFVYDYLGCPMEFTCNGCLKVSSKPLMKCSVCREACYCNKTCQRMHWKKHKSICTPHDE